MDGLTLCGGADVETRLETPTRQRWREVLSAYAGPEEPGRRRTDERYYIALGSVKLAFEQDGAPVERTGRVLNASEGGLMIKQYEGIPPETLLQIEATIGEESFALAGRVAHCTQTVGGFKVGIELKFAD
jgi:hypothetical protein